jgi:uncharacterized protein (TIGR02722 family)
LSRILCLRASAILLAIMVLVTLPSGCSRKTVSRVDIEEQIDLSGNWNDTDSRLVAEDLIAQSTNAPWIDNFLKGKGAEPTVIIGRITNKTVEHIPVKTFIADLERSFINSGRVKVVASSEEREGVREERADQQEYALPETVKRWGLERGADYMLLGEINTIVDSEGGKEVKYYQVDCYLVDLQDNTKVWTGYKKIKKYIGRSKYKP